jgi:hypothetical protein
VTFAGITPRVQVANDVALVSVRALGSMTIHYEGDGTFARCGVHVGKHVVRHVGGEARCRACRLLAGQPEIRK